ncbi:uncharacterized protein SETTUDRAFT_18766 [Exserohilum turcica Et28A]|uniref:Uncharacterized protein n=1 Tax=Exserohilum turcicum (strain 28A) TaxID=671987 RepID=R0KGY6_EXST2|nr:uncharacterized protein SETTUDRAFT_18766 [Exserohilum turcica Et28A]EOA92113.1 hypothetical protein SETTUDRAFT_18766 [Exserohilum turcica Et28A]
MADTSCKLPATHILQNSFSPAFHHALVANHATNHPANFLQLVESQVELVTGLDIHGTWPDSIAHFLCVFDTVFSERAKQQIVQNMRCFEQTSDMSADALIGHLTFSGWVRRLVEQMDRCDEVGAGAAKMSLDGGTRGSLMRGKCK